MSTNDFVGDEFLPEDRSDAAGPDDFMDIPGDDTGDVELPFAERVASALDGPDADWMRNTGFRTEADLVRSYREMQARATRAEQEREQVIQAFQSSEEAPDYGYQPPQQYGDDQFRQAAEWLGNQVDSGDMPFAQALGTIMDAVLPQMIEQKAQQIIGQQVNPVAQRLERRELDEALAEAEAQFGPAEAKRMGPQVMSMMKRYPHLANPDGMRIAFRAVAGEHAVAQRQRAQRAPGMETVDTTSRSAQRQQDMTSALEAWILKPGP